MKPVLLLQQVGTGRSETAVVNVMSTPEEAGTGQENNWR